MKLSNYINIKNGRHNTQDCTTDGKYPFFDRSSVIKKSNVFLFDQEAIIFPGEGSVFLPKYYNGKFDLHQRCYCIYSKNSNVLNKYIYYYLYQNRDYFSKVATGSTVKSLRIKHFLDMDVNFHKLDIQQHIVNTIGSVDDLIENYQKQIEQILTILTGSINEYREYTQIRYYEPKIIKSGISKFEGNKYYIDTSSVDGINNVVKKTLINYENKPSRANMKVIPNSVWFAKMKDSYKIILITEKDTDLLNDYILSTGFMGIKCDYNLPLSLVFSIIISDEFIQQRDSNSTGTIMMGINNNIFLNINVPKLSNKQISNFDKKYSIYIQKLSKIRQKINALIKGKNLLLDKYF